MWGGLPADPAKLEKIHVAFEFLNTFLEGQNYVAGKNLTIADIVLLTSVSNFPVLICYLSRYIFVSIIN